MGSHLCWLSGKSPKLTRQRAIKFTDRLIDVLERGQTALVVTHAGAASEIIAYLKTGKLDAKGNFRPEMGSAKLFEERGDTWVEAGQAVPECERDGTTCVVKWHEAEEFKQS